MRELSAEILLRPTRIGFLTSPTDLAAVRQMMRASVCLWGGVFNPIIPVFKRAPTEWHPEIYERFKGAEVAKGYARFFEPDVYVEAEKGLLEEAGLGALRQKHALHPQVNTLKEFLEPKQDRNWSEPAFGLNVCDVLEHIYKTDQQFVHRDEQESLYVRPERGSCIAEAMFGVYPTAKPVKYIEQAYRDAYRPEVARPTPETWRRVFLKGATTPLRVTRYGLDLQRYWHHDLIIYVFDPLRSTDLIDLWNLRLEPCPVLPVPLEWFDELSDDIHKILRQEHRPVVGNPHGVMHNATIEFGRSIAKAKAESLIRTLKPGLPKGALAIKYWRNAIWVEHRNDHVHRDDRLKVTAKERRADLVLKEEGQELRTTFAPLAPEFARRYGDGEARWVNVLKISNYGNRDVATVLPFNTFDRSWPRLGLGSDDTVVGSEGWVFQQKFAELGQYVCLVNANDAIVGSLAQLEIKAELSEPGHIAQQMLEQLGGLWGVHLLADIDTLKLLNKMAGGLRRKSNEKEVVEETYELRTAPLSDWVALVSARKKRHAPSTHDLSDFTKSNVIRLGLDTDCPHCSAKNWSNLTDVDYRVTCERCLKPYDFPQAALRPNNRNFSYRVIGPFSVPDYGRGSYSALLTLRVLERLDSPANGVTFSTAMNLSFGDERCEVDFVAWHSGQFRHQVQRPPRLIIGESKSLGQGELITARDLAKIKLVAARLPDAVIVISVMREDFTRDEKELLRKFANWARRVNIHGEPKNPLVLLTARELTMEYMLSETWEALGGAHARFATYDHTRDLLALASATQQIYLGMPSFDQARRKYWDQRMARRKVARNGA